MSMIIANASGSTTCGTAWRLSWSLQSRPENRAGALRHSDVKTTLQLYAHPCVKRGPHGGPGASARKAILQSGSASVN